MTTINDGKEAVLSAVEVDLNIEELEPIAAPGVATSPGPFGGLRH